MLIGFVLLGTRIIYDRNALLLMRNSPLSKTPPVGIFLINYFHLFMYLLFPTLFFYFIYIPHISILMRWLCAYIEIIFTLYIFFNFMYFCVIIIFEFQKKTCLWFQEWLDQQDLPNNYHNNTTNNNLLSLRRRCAN